MIDLTWMEVRDLIQRLPHSIRGTDALYGIPRGGSITAAVMSAMFENPIVDSPEDADVIIDDILDSGETMKSYIEQYPDKKFAVLTIRLESLEFAKKHGVVFAEYFEDWIVFPWEKTEGRFETVEDNVRRVMQFIGEDVNRPGIIETPKRVAKMYEELFSGYNDDPMQYLKLFDSDDANGIVVVSDIMFFSTCEHHMVPFYGKCSIGYIPGGKIIGLSKLARIVNAFARRLQVQERLTKEIANFLMENLEAEGVIVFMNGIHMCMAMRGVKNQTAHTISVEVRGSFEEDDLEQKFLRMLQTGGHI